MPFSSSIAVSAVCGFCRSIVVRRGANVESMGVLAELPPDVTPLQPGTRGQWNGHSFELIGRLRVTWDGGTWNEWCAEFADGRQGWVAETQGFCTVSFHEAAKDLPADLDALVAGMPLRFAGKVWSVVDIKDVRCQSGEGQLPFEFDAQWRRRSVDLIAADGSFGSLERDDEGTAFFSGAAVPYTQLSLSNLRPVPGWSADAETVHHQSATLGCPSCGAAVNLHAAGQTMAAVCGSCGSVIDTANPHLQLIQKADERVRKLNPVLPLGKRGRLFDVEYEVVGFVVREDRYSKWQEYLLFNPWHGFDWLVTFRGHWSFVRRVLDLGNLDGSKLRYDGRSYSIYARGNAAVVGVLGEFYWKVERGETAQLQDWICPPYILSKETYPGLKEFTWSHGTYVEPEVIRTAFGLEKIFPPTGLYLNQPNPYAARWRTVRGWLFLFLAVYLVIQAFFALRIVTMPVYSGSFAVEKVTPAPGTAPKILTTPHFELKGGSQPVWITARAPVNNQWLGLDVDLVNAATNQTFSVPVTVEFYQGYEGGSAWTEGDQQETEAIAAVPPGTYFLNIDVDPNPAVAGMNFDIAVKRGGLFWSNFWTGLVALLLYPATVYFRRGSFEASRWSESDFTPSGGANTSE